MYISQYIMRVEKAVYHHSKIQSVTIKVEVYVSLVVDRKKKNETFRFILNLTQLCGK